MRDALSQVKQEQGADAVILGNKKVPGGVEIISAIDYDEEAVRSFQNECQHASATIGSGQSGSGAPGSARLSDVASDVWVGSLINGSSGDRREPVLGPVANVGNKRDIKPVQRQRPAWLDYELNRIEKSQAESAPPKPLKTEARVGAKKLVAKKGTCKSAAVKPQSKAKQVLYEEKLPPIVKAKVSAAQTAGQPLIKEVKHELKNLRDLMESQLSVLQWDKFSQRHPVRSVLLNLLSELGLGADICEMVFSHLHHVDSDPQKVWQKALNILARCLPESRRDLLAEGGRIALVGSTGVGKTTTIAKLAARFAHNHGKKSVAMISTDHFRIGAQEQLQHYARLLEIPLLTASSSEELADRLDMLSDKKLVLIDTAGMSQRDLRISEQFHELQHGSPEIRPYLVLSANTQLAALSQTIQSFSKVRLAGAFVTKIDEAASLGGIITASVRHQLALTYCGTGQRVPEDLEAAKNNRLIGKAVSLMQQFSEQSDQQAMAFRYNHIINKKHS
jgi:flagellar biosynthesis protein FlhF